MARAKANKLYRTFVKGLVTEASPLTYPEDTSYNEKNTILSRKGSRTRRKGQTYLLSSIDAGMEVTDWETSQTEFVWKAVGRNPNLNFLVVQKGNTVKFYDLAFSTNTEREKSFSIDLSLYARPGVTGEITKSNLFQMASGKGYLYIVGRDIEPIYVEYDSTTDTISVYKIIILIRDFDGLKDNLTNDEEPTTLTKEHHYNLMNQGWLYGSTSATTYSPVSYPGYTFNPRFEYYNQYPVELGSETGTAYQTVDSSNSPIFKFQSVIGRYPGNNKQWWVARAAADDPDTGAKAGDFLPEVLDKLYSGNNAAPRGHYIINAFYKDRTKVSGISDIPVQTLDYRPEAVAFFSGRAWYGAGSTVYFSQILDSTGGEKSGLCYQEADPTAEDISDLIASDGGAVPIPEIDRIVKLIPLANGVLVFAQNGVWFISGGDSSFSATNISTDKISSIGTKSPMAAYEVDGTLFWWSDTGIQAMQQSSGQFGPIPGKFGNNNISEQTVQTVYNEISDRSRRLAKVEYDHVNNRLMWLYNKNRDKDFQYDTCLLFDLTLQAFFLWEFSHIENGPTVNGFYLNTSEVTNINEIQIVNNGDIVVSNDLSNVVIDGNIISYGPSNIEYIVNVPGDGMAISQTEDNSFVDWATFDGTGVAYESFIETGFEILDDAMRQKQAIYVFVHLRRQDNSSCKMITKWDWATSANSNRWSNEVQVYRDRIRPDNSTADLNAFEVATSKNKVRGHGKAIQFKFWTDEVNKNFDLLGWSVAYIGNTEA